MYGRFIVLKFLIRALTGYFECGINSGVYFFQLFIFRAFHVGHQRRERARQHEGCYMLG